MNCKYVWQSAELTDLVIQHITSHMAFLYILLEVQFVQVYLLH